MTIDELMNQTKDKMTKTRDYYQKDMLTLRAGRANPQILDKIMVDYYGTQTPLKQMGNVMAPEPRLLTISLWDAKAIPLVEKAILKSDLGLNPSNDGKIIRLVVPGTPWKPSASSRRTARSPRTTRPRPKRISRR